jgi:NAD(P)H dehydrogenase (quinone)
VSEGAAPAIAITGASGQVGTLLRERLAKAPARVLPLGRGDDWRTGIAAADAVVHLAGTLQPKRGESYEAANVATARRVAEAAASGGARRIVFLSYVGASADSANEYLRAKAAAERLLLDTGVPTTIFRCLHVYGPPDHPGPTAAAFLAKRGRVVVPGTGRQRIQPLYVGDVVSAVASAVTRPDAPTGSFDLGGPEEMPMDDFVRALNEPGVKIHHLPAPVARVSARLAPTLTPALMDLLLCDNVTATPAAEVGERFGFTPRRLAEVWR